MGQRRHGFILNRDRLILDVIVNEGEIQVSRIAGHLDLEFDGVILLLVVAQDAIQVTFGNMAQIRCKGQKLGDA